MIRSLAIFLAMLCQLAGSTAQPSDLPPSREAAAGC